MHIDAAPTGTHITGGFFHLIGYFLRGVDFMLGHVGYFTE
jgi:hypothetical protein